MLDALRLALLPERTDDDERLIAAILAGVDAGLAHVLRGSALEAPAEARLGFRELGLAIGLQAVPQGREGADTFSELARIGAPHLQRIAERTDIGDRIVAFWSDAGNRQASTWTEHRDINEVMLSTALLSAHAATGDIAKHLAAAPAHSSP